MPSSTFLRHHRPQQDHYYQSQRQQEKPQVQPASPKNALRAPSPYDLYAPDPTVPHYSSTATPSSQSSPWPALTAEPSPSSQLATNEDFTTAANSAISLASAAAAFPLHLPKELSLPQPSQSQASSASASASSPLSKGALRALRRGQLQASQDPLCQQERLIPRQQVSAAAQAAGVSNDRYSNLLNSNRQLSPTRARGLHPDSRFAVAATATAVDNWNRQHRHWDRNFHQDRSASPTKKSLVAALSGYNSLANNRAESPVSVTIPGGYSSISYSPERTRYPPRRLFDDAASAYSAISNSSNTSIRRPSPAPTNNSSSVVEQLSLADPFSNRYALPDSRSPSPQRGRPLPPLPPPLHSTDSVTVVDEYTDIPVHPSAIMNASNPQLAAVVASESSNRSSHASNQSSSTSTAGYVSNPSPNDYSYPSASPPSPVYGPNVPLRQDFDMPLPPRLTSSVAGSSSRSPSRSASSLRDPFQDDHYSNYASSRSLDPRLGEVNPALIADDGDDGLTYHHRSGHSSMINLHKKRDSITPSVKAAAAMGGAVMLNALPGGGGGGASTPTSRRSTAYGNVPGVSVSTGVLGGAAAAGFTKSALEEKTASAGASAGGKTRNRRLWKWFIIVVFGILIVGAIIGGTLGGYLANHSAKGKSKSSSSSGESADDDTSKNGILTKDSDEIKKLLNNKDLHKVFPGMDYTPLNTQYPDCLKNRPSQNNVTRDMAVLSQLTNVIRVYGTDCNQTEMIIQAFDYLDISDTMSIWLGVWQDSNSTTNDRQLSQMWDILNTYGDKPFKGLIIANEILYREEMTETELGTLMSSVRSNLTAKGLSLPVGTSDLGDKWTSSLADKSDVIMSNIHPFFGGVPYDQAANWTYSFFINHNEDYFKSTASDNIISEIGWPTSGGTNCPTGVTTCDSSDGSEASIDGLNVLLSDWVCDALTNGTNYFWFSAFDEPWKEKFDEEGKAWEDQWGLMDVNRNLKSGVTIPDCGGKTVP